MKNILFVCQGNICRSPSAEAVFNAFIKNRNLESEFQCDSAGTISYHNGEPADSRMQVHANKRGYRLTSISRKVTSMDFKEFDLLIAMDYDNKVSLERFAPSVEDARKIVMMTDYCSKQNPGEVPDPYYGGAAGFENVLDILEDACEGLLESLTAV